MTQEGIDDDRACVKSADIQRNSSKEFTSREVFHRIFVPRFFPIHVSSSPQFLNVIPPIETGSGSEINFPSTNPALPDKVVGEKRTQLELERHFQVPTRVPRVSRETLVTFSTFPSVIRE